ncbi:zinc finger BED domain-containing protein 4-like [Antennarius striatus]|uniref:zinc finger BED domain-containing protein 4-like n=1 Tax=Antennarius striatus TaxID=241820 RepID=UPI0035B1A72C
MGRHCENPMRQHFSYDPATNKSICNIEGCGAEIKGNHGGNLQRHIQRRHPDIFKNSSTGVGLKRTASTGQKTLDEEVVKKPKVARVPINPEVLVDACLELVTVNGRPFSLMEDSGFRKIIDPLQQAIGNGFTINSANIREKVANLAQIERKKLIDELNGRLLMLKIDIATCRDRSVLGINVQYACGECIVLRTLAVRELNERHTGSYISSVVQEVLTEYKVSLKQIYSITADNGANMQKAVRTLSDTQANESIDEDDESDVDAEPSDEYQVDPLVEIDSVVQGRVLRSVRCSAHTLQLAVEDALKDKLASDVISAARCVAKKLCTANVLAILKRMGHKRPVIDCPMRWHSTYDMLDRLCELKTFCDYMSPTINELHLNESEWLAISDIVNVLKPAKITTQCIQSEQLTAGDFYGLWLKCMLDTQKIESPFAKRVVQCMKGRQNSLFENDAFVAALFVDPRYRLFLTENQSEMAKIHLCRTWEVIQNLTVEVGAERTPSSSSEDDDEIDQLLMAKERETTVVQRDKIPIVSVLDAYAREPRLKRNENILRYWASMAATNPDMQKLAMSVIALPVTQVSLKHAVSCLKFIFSPLRSSLNDRILEDILFIRLNNRFGL